MSWFRLIFYPFRVRFYMVYAVEDLLCLRLLPLATRCCTQREESNQHDCNMQPICEGRFYVHLYFRFDIQGDVSLRFDRCCLSV